MSKPPAFLLTVDTVKKDYALGERGARKWLVTDLYASKEVPVSQLAPDVPQRGKKCHVLVMEDTEVAVFTDKASQDRHFHQKGTEIYAPIEGCVTVEVQGQVLTVSPGDMIVINPGAVHRVDNSKGPFLCRVINVNCGGASDKVIVED